MRTFKLNGYIYNMCTLATSEYKRWQVAMANARITTPTVSEGKLTTA